MELLAAVQEMAGPKTGLSVADKVGAVGARTHTGTHTGTRIHTHRHTRTHARTHTLS